MDQGGQAASAVWTEQTTCWLVRVESNHCCYHFDTGKVKITGHGVFANFIYSALGLSVTPLRPPDAATLPFGRHCAGKLVLLEGCHILDKRRGTASVDTIRPSAQATNLQLVTSLYALCIQKMSPTACALLEFAEAPLRILMVSGVFDIGIPTSTSPALDIAALYLSSWPAAIFTQTVPASLLSASSLL